MKRIKIFVASIMVIMLVVLSGCQSVDGLNIKKAMVDSNTVKSMESKHTFSIEVVPSTDNIQAEDKELFDLMNSFSLQIDHMAVEDESTASMEGSISLDGKKLPFHVSVDEKEVMLWVEGAKKAISVPMDTLTSAYGIALSDIQPTMEQSKQWIQSMSKFFFDNAPNPKSIAVTSVTDMVYGEQLNLKKLHVDIHGDELVSLAKSFLTNVTKDKEGVKELIGTLYDVYYPIYEAGLDIDSEEYAEEYVEDAYAEEEYVEEEYVEDEYVDNGVPPFATWESVIQDKEATVIYVTNQLQKTINDMLKEYDREVNSLIEEDETLTELLSKNTVLTMDYMFDDKLQLRKQNMNLVINLSATEDIPLTQIKMNYKTENWHVNQPVQIHKVDRAQGVLEMDMLAMEKMTAGTIMRNFDEQSEVYRFLKEDLAITNQYVILDTIEDEEYGWYYDYPRPIDVGTTKMVPLRHVAEQFEAKMTWDKQLNQVTITEDLTGKIIVLKRGSNIALVNNNKVKMTEAFMNYDGNSYVPLHFISNVLGATVEWDNDSKSIILERP
ncbi:copper amine oxidase N-terminal domain-containing protein [Paenibacillus sp. CMAA1364]